MEEIALFIATDPATEILDGNNYNLIHLDFLADYSYGSDIIGKIFKNYCKDILYQSYHFEKVGNYFDFEIQSYSLINYKDLFIGSLLMNVSSSCEFDKLKIKLKLSINSFYDDFDERYLKGLLNYLHLDHSENLKIPKLSHGYKKFIEIKFTNEIKIPSLIFLIKLDKLICRNLYRNIVSNYTMRIDDKYTNGFKYDIHLKMKSFKEYPLNDYIFSKNKDSSLIYNKDNHEKFIKAILIYDALNNVHTVLDDFSNSVSVFKKVMNSYKDFFINHLISEEEFIENFYNWGKISIAWIRRFEYRLKNRFLKKIMEIIIWMNDYLDDERKKLFEISKNKK